MELAVLLGLVTERVYVSFGPPKEMLPNSEKLERGLQLWIPSAFELTLNLLGRR